MATWADTSTGRPGHNSRIVAGADSSESSVETADRRQSRSRAIRLDSPTFRIQSPDSVGRLGRKRRTGLNADAGRS